MTEDNKEKIPMYECPRFSKCSAPICPLDPDWTERVYIEGEEKCTMQRSVRERLGGTLPNKGLKYGEFTNSKYWESLPNCKRVIIRDGTK